VPAGRYVVRITASDGTGSASNVSTGPVDVHSTIRLAGPERLATAIALSRAAFADGAPAAVLARSTQFPDALAAAPLAAAAGGPLLLNSTERLEEQVGDELLRLGVDRVYVMGGQAAQSSAVLRQLEQLGDFDVVRVSGPDRFRTAAAAADTAARLWRAAGHADAGKEVLVALGEDFPDALASGPLAAHDRRVLLLTGRSSAPQATLDELGELGAERVTIVGGPAAVSRAVEDRLRRDGHAVSRIAGTTRHETAELAARAAVEAGADAKTLIVASGRQFPDALAAGPAVQALGGVLLLTEPAVLPGVTAAWVAGRKPLQLLRIAGGPAAISDPVQAELRRLAR
jgi:putative cell wall-binding protein